MIQKKSDCTRDGNIQLKAIKDICLMQLKITLEYFEEKEDKIFSEKLVWNWKFGTS